MTTPPSPPPPPRRETDAAQAPAEPRPPAELWGIWSIDTRHWQAGGFGDNYFAHGTQEAAERSATRQQHAGNDVVAALIGISPIVREQRDRLKSVVAALLTIIEGQCLPFIRGTDDGDRFSLLEELEPKVREARLALSEIEGGGRVGTTGEQGDG
jgi:hypothetical protein